jgi:uncharacterized membrane protein YeaQ/YmgE (transglycosylase-associated protein family)
MNEPITLAFVLQQPSTWLTIVLLGGSLDLLIRGRGQGVILSVVVGLLGGMLGSFIFTLLHIGV